ncbi:o-succinylbenzoate--CoA ligase [Corynebacterium sp. 335C]
MTDAEILRTLPVPRGRRALGVLPDLAAALEGGRPLLPVPEADAERAAQLARTQRAGEPVDAGVAVVMCTSGSTGDPKGALLTGANLASSADATHARLGGPGRWLLATPADHVAGLQVLLRSVRAGFEPAAMELDGGFDPAELARAVDAMDGPRRYLSLVPLQLAKALDHPAGAAALAELDAVLVGGQAADPALLARARAAGVRCVTTYGSSETCGGCVYDGVPLDGARAELDDGRIVLSGPMVARGYRNPRPELADGVFRTSDAGAFDDAGRLRVLGRLDDVIVSGGLKHHPGPIEEALARIDGVDAACVAGVPDDRLGQAIAALYAGSAEPEAVRAAAREALGAHRAPRRVVRADALPLLPSGKIDRRRAADMLDR